MNLLASSRPSHCSVTCLVLVAISVFGLGVTNAGAQMGGAPCSRDGTVLTCTHLGAGVIVGASGPETTELNVENFGFAFPRGVGAALLQNGDVAVNVDGLNSFDRALFVAAGDDGRLTIGDVRAVIAGDAPEPPSAELVERFLEIVGEQSGTDTSTNDAVVSVSDVRLGTVALFSVLQLEEVATEDGTVTAGQIFNALPFGLSESDRLAFLNALFSNDDLTGTETISSAEAQAAVQAFIFDGNVGSSLDPASINVTNDFDPSRAIVGVSGSGNVEVTNTASLVSRSKMSFGILAQSAVNNGLSDIADVPEAGESGGAVTVNNQGNIIIDTGSESDSGFISGTGIRAQSGDRFAGGVLTSPEAPGNNVGTPGGDVSVTNSGDITALRPETTSFTPFDGIRARSNGGDVSVINSGDIDLLTQMNSDSGSEGYGRWDTRGISASGTPVSNINIVNSGDIKSLEDGIRFWQGDEFGAQGAPGTVQITNTGDITVLTGNGIVGSAYGETSIENSGDITLQDSSRAAIAAQNDAANAVSITNDGKLTTNGEGSVGIVGFSANDDDVDAPGTGTVTIDNAGEVSVSGGSNAGISGFTGEGGTAPSINITTRANVTAKDENSSGIFAGAFETPGASLEINIVGADTTVHGGTGSQHFRFSPPPEEGLGEPEAVIGAAGIMMLGGGTTLINNAGTITGENGQAIRAVDGTLTVFDFVVDADGRLVFDPKTHAPLREPVDIEVAAADDTVNNSGTIAGDVNLGHGKNTVDNKAGGTIEGDVNAGNGSDTYVNAGTHTGDVDLANGGPGEVKVAAEVPGDTSGLSETAPSGPERGNDRYENSGTHTGNTRLGFGDNSFTNQVDGRVEGRVDAGLGNDSYSNDGTHIGDVDLSNPGSVAATSPREPTRKVSLTGDAGLMSDNDSYENSGTHTGNINLGAGANALTNSGKLTGDVVSRSGDDTFNNSGELTGDVTAGNGKNVFSNMVDAIFSGNFFGGSGQDDVTNKGGQVGDVNLGDGTNTFTNDGGFQGTVFAGSGDDSVTNAGLFDGSLDLGVGTNAFTNAVGGELSSGDTFNVGAGNQVVNAGILFPGGTGVLQTTRVTGDFVQRTSGTFEVDIDDREKDATDRIDVAGSADLAGTVVPNVIHLSEVDGDGEAIDHAFTILTATDGVTDSGLTLNVIDTIGFDFDLQFADNGRDVLLTAVAAREVAPLLVGAGGTNGTQGGNGLAAVMVLDDGAKRSPALKQLSNALRNQTDAAALKQAVERLTPKSQSTQVTGAMAGSAALGNAMLSCTTREGEHAYTREGQCYWGKVTVRNLDRDATAGHSGVDEDGVAFSAGIQFALQNEFRLGFGLSYETTDSTSTSQTQALGKTEGDRFQAGVVLKNQWGPVNAYLNIVGGYGSFDHTRFGVLATNTAEQDVKTFMTRLRLSYLYALGALNVRPMVDFSATYIGLDGYTETGAGALTVADADEWFLSVTPALEIAGEIRSGSTIFRPYARAGVTFIDQDSLSVQTNFAAAPAGVQPFTINSDLEDTFAVVEAGLHVLNESGFNLRFTYDGRYGEDSQEHAGSLKASKNF